MDLELLLGALLLGIVEGLTEFIPVSSTGHLILVIDLIGFRGPPGKVFEVVIQLGAILAVCWAYRHRFLRVAAGLQGDPDQIRFARNILLGFVPAMVIGALAHGFIKTVLFSPWVVVTTLVLGGLAILLIERIRPTPRHEGVEGLPALTAFQIGCCQAVAMIPGISRSGATIMGGLMLGVDRRTATEFSFFLAVPTMLAATVYDTYKNWAVMNNDSVAVIAVGFAAAFLAALFVVRRVLDFVSRRGFAPFAWYRIGVGLLMATFLLLR
ncbi:MAG TPA: undecaprenyl-diphosphate phosphatase [Geminicoccaceae bacterium]|jgi:undecaprenyl-diphosphatase|nr:undecaprenyl-diphosphate phosphatase [Geminicoccaceae bacterium]